MAESTSKSDVPDVADRVYLPSTGPNPYEEAYAESNPGRTKTVDPYGSPEEDVLTQDGFIGVDPVYQNYASIGGRPLNGDDKIGRVKASNGSVPDLEEPLDTGSNENSDNSNAETTPTDGAPTPQVRNAPPVPSK